MRWMIGVLMALGACGDPPLAAESGGVASCGADKVQDLIGQPVAGHGNRLAANARIIPPEAAITQDFSLDRLNVDLDGNGLITRIWCG